MQYTSQLFCGSRCYCTCSVKSKHYLADCPLFPLKRIAYVSEFLFQRHHLNNAGLLWGEDTLWMQKWTQSFKKKSETRIHTHKGAKESKHIKGSKERYLLEITLKIHMLCFVLVNSVLLSLKKTEMSLQKWTLLSLFNSIFFSSLSTQAVFFYDLWKSN